MARQCCLSLFVMLCKQKHRCCRRHPTMRYWIAMLHGFVECWIAFPWFTFPSSALQLQIIAGKKEKSISYPGHCFMCVCSLVSTRRIQFWFYAFHIIASANFLESKKIKLIKRNGLFQYHLLEGEDFTRMNILSFPIKLPSGTHSTLVDATTLMLKIIFGNVVLTFNVNSQIQQI